MPIYSIRKTYKHTETVEVQAETEREALEISNDVFGESNNDDWLYDAEVIGVCADESNEER